MSTITIEGNFKKGTKLIADVGSGPMALVARKSFGTHTECSKIAAPRFAPPLNRREQRAQASINRQFWRQFGAK